jgi:15-cis-phytoene synthase
VSEAGKSKEAKTVNKAGSSGEADARTAAAYLFCRDVARREAKNFYWAFRVLPRYKSDGMCAVYAFMRRADDISDDESKSIEARRAEMTRWLEVWRATRASENEASDTAFDDPVFVALGDAQQRFGIPDALLEELVSGTTMDLEPQAVAGAADVQTFATFEDLYRYCYLVASVVGLVCIRIFGYSDARAEQLAEETGVAFQLTNILRDVKEDVERGRAYIPVDLMDEFGETVVELRELARGRAMTERERGMLATLAIRAEKYYLAGKKLIPLLDRDSRAAMWVLVTIYHRLLSRIADRKMDVFGQRVSLSTGEKVSIMARGAMMAAWNRVVG